MRIARFDEAHFSPRQRRCQDRTIGKINVLLRKGKALHELASLLETIRLHISFGKYAAIVVLETVRQQHSLRTEKHIEPSELSEEQRIMHDEVIFSM